MKTRNVRLSHGESSCSGASRPGMLCPKDRVQNAPGFAPLKK
jgi:hypothetical protein